MSLAQAIAEAGGIPSAFSRTTPIGTTVSGTIVSADLRQTTDISTQQPQTWDDGSPKQQVVITLDTALRDPANPDDDGKRRVYVKFWGDQKKALLAAIYAAKDNDLRPGGQFAATYTGDGQAAAAHLSPPKLYSFTYSPPPTGLAQAVQATPPQQAAPAQQYQQAPPVQQAPPQYAQQAAPAQQVQQPPAGTWGAPQQAAPPAPAPAQQGGQDVELASRIMQLAAINLPDESIAAALGITVEQVQANKPF